MAASSHCVCLEADNSVVSLVSVPYFRILPRFIPGSIGPFFLGAVRRVGVLLAGFFAFSVFSACSFSHFFTISGTPNRATVSKTHTFSMEKGSYRFVTRDFDGVGGAC